jgi:hypothetical protein
MRAPRAVSIANWGTADLQIWQPFAEMNLAPLGVQLHNGKGFIPYIVLGAARGELLSAQDARDPPLRNHLSLKRSVQAPLAPRALARVAAVGGGWTREPRLQAFRLR